MLADRVSLQHIKPSGLLTEVQGTDLCKAGNQSSPVTKIVCLILVPAAGQAGMGRRDSLDASTVADSMLDSAELDDALDDDIDEDEEAEADAQVAEGTSKAPAADPRQALQQAKQAEASTTGAAARP